MSAVDLLALHAPLQNWDSSIELQKSHYSNITDNTRQCSGLLYLGLAEEERKGDAVWITRSPRPVEVPENRVK